jgi:hypothetical protein
MNINNKNNLNNEVELTQIWFDIIFNRFIKLPPVFYYVILLVAILIPS